MSTDLAPVEQEKVGELAAEVNDTVAAARAIVVQTPEQAEQAVELLSGIATAKRKSEKARRFIVDPMNAHIKTINGRFKTTTAPLDEADKLVREKVLAYETERQRQAKIEQDRIDAERRAAEAERRRVADEAARVEREAREAEQRRQTELRDAANERAREISMLSGGELADLARGKRGEALSPDAELAIQEIASRHRAKAAQKLADQARREAEEATQRSIAAASAPATAVAEPKLQAASGSASTSKVWKATVVEEDRVPLRFRPVDQKLINAALRAGERDIPGVRIEQVDQLAVRPGR